MKRTSANSLSTDVDNQVKIGRRKIISDLNEREARDFIGQTGVVALSSTAIQCIACSRLSPHIVGSGWSDPQTSGRSGWPKILQRSALSS